MVMCWALGCKHYNERETCKFFRFPKDMLKKKWIELLGRNVEPGPGAFVCSCHFRDMNKENGPELHSYNVKNEFTSTSREKKQGTCHSNAPVVDELSNSPVIKIEADLAGSPQSMLMETVDCTTIKHEGQLL